MAKYILYTMYHPTPGREREMDEWHWNHHTPSVLAVPGFVSAQRFHLAEHQLDRDAGLQPGVPDSPQPPRVAPWPYLVIYEVETDDLPSVIDGFYEAAAKSTTPMPEGARDDTRPGQFYFFKAVTEKLESKVATHPQIEPDGRDAVAAAQRALGYLDRADVVEPQVS